MKDFIAKAGKGKRGSRDLTFDEASSAMECLLSGIATPYQVGAFLMAMRVKGESVDELAAFTSVAIRYNRPLNIEGKRLLNIPSYAGKKETLHVLAASAILISAAGQPVIIHGFKDNRYKIGIGKILEAMGMSPDLGIDDAAYLLNHEGFSYVDLKEFNPLLYKLLLLRDELGVRTSINTIALLTNPGTANRHIIGIAHPPVLKKIGDVLRSLGYEDALLLKGPEAGPELSIMGITMGMRLEDAVLLPQDLAPSDFGLQDGKREDMAGAVPEAEARVIKGILDNSINDNRRNWVVMNGALGLYVSGRVISPKDGVSVILETLSSGKGYQKYLSILDRQKELLQMKAKAS
ncbi:MAG: hypothetical protein AAB266_06035 [Nitrospirota bacterium]